MLGFVAALGATFKGDVLVQLARAPMGVALVFALVITGTLVPEIDAEAGYIPGNVRQGVDKLLAATGLADFFSETAEIVNGRAAMLGFLGKKKRGRKEALSVTDSPSLCSLHHHGHHLLGAVRDAHCND